jgi:diguanylate cyclase (GGDEF)-like protein
MSLSRISLALAVLLCAMPPAARTADDPPARAGAPTGTPQQAVPIATLLADRDEDTIPDAKGETARVRGVVTVASDVLRTRDLQIVIQDETGGIGLFHQGQDIDLARGDIVEATGRVTQFRGAVQLRDAEVRRVGRGKLPDARRLAVGQASGWTHMGRRVRIEGIAGDLSLDSFGMIELTGDDGATTSLFIPAPVADSFDWKQYPRGARLAATGVLAIYKHNWPYDDGFQIIVSRPDELELLAAPAPAWQGWALRGAAAVAAVLALALLVFHLLQSRQKERQRELAALAALSSAMSVPDLGEEQLARHACDILTAYAIVEVAAVQVLDERGYLRQLATATVDPKLARVLEIAEPLSATGSAGSAHQQQIEAHVAGHGLTLLAVHPLLAPSGTQGFLVALSPRKRGPSNMQERTLLAAVKLLAMALENSRNQQRARQEQRELQQLVITDELTKLYNRRFLDEYLRVQIPLAQRRGEGPAFLAIDIDHFKQINDTWGHEAGDRVLASVATLLRQASRSSDLPVRLGGEEFLAVIAETDPAGAMTFAERLRDAIAGHAFDDAVAGTTLRVTVSIGVAVFGLHGETAAALLRASDEAMYASKRAGRNRVTLATGAASPVIEAT